jgi:hypothetical protein
LDLATQKESDVMVISEPGKKATEQALTWGTHHISPQESATHHKRTQLGKTNRENMKYLVYAAHGDKGDGEGGVVILLHENIYTIAGYMYYPRNPPVGLSLSFPIIPT